MRDGERVMTSAANQLDRDAIIKAMVGRTLSGELYRREGTASRPAGRRVLSVQDLSMGNIIRNNSFTIYAGQVTGMFGLIGSGRMSFSSNFSPPSRLTIPRSVFASSPLTRVWALASP